MPIRIPVTRVVAVLALGITVAADPATAEATSPAVAGGDPVHRRVFVTSTTGSGLLGGWDEVLGEGLSGLVAGDAICQERADEAGLSSAGDPVFVAWLSNTTDDAYCRVQGLTGKRGGACDGAPALPGAGPWMRVDGLPWGDTLDVLTSFGLPGGPHVQLDIDEEGSLLPQGNFMTGTSETGESSVPTRDCDGWTSEDPADTWSGSSTLAVDGWSGGAAESCSPLRRLLCMERGTGDPIPRPKGEGALVFVTSTSCAGELGACTAAPSDSGIEAGDNFCRERAVVAGLPRPQSFFAWLSVEGGPTMASRITGTGPWRRVDGYPVAQNPADWFDGRLAAVPFVDEHGNQAPLATSAWTGTDAFGVASPFDCGDWDSALAGSSGTDGWVERANELWSESPGTPRPCDTPRRLYCLSNETILFWDNFELENLSRWDGESPMPSP